MDRDRGYEKKEGQRNGILRRGDRDRVKSRKRDRDGGEGGTEREGRRGVETE